MGRGKSTSRMGKKKNKDMGRIIHQKGYGQDDSSERIRTGCFIRLKDMGKMIHQKGYGQDDSPD